MRSTLAAAVRARSLRLSIDPLMPKEITIAYSDTICNLAFFWFTDANRLSLDAILRLASTKPTQIWRPSASIYVKTSSDSCSQSRERRRLAGIMKGTDFKSR